MQEEISWDHFEAVELRVGTVTEVKDFPEAKRPAYQVWVDFGADTGVKKSSAQVTELYAKEDLVGRQVVGVVNFPDKQIGPFRSEFLLTGFVTDEGVVLAQPERPVDNGAKLA
jgi:tRNA-binding protein